MNKPTIFFSHSGKDGEMILLLKNRLLEITGSTIDIFQSSDGQSIRFGRNWVHRIEEALNDAEIMFVFITPNSMMSNWIYFEAGHAYAKGIDVVPVGLGLDISTLSAPLSLLQGFNIISCEGLNNLVTSINENFDCKFPASFSDEDFARIADGHGEVANSTILENIFDSIKCQLGSTRWDAQDNTTIHDFSDYFDKVEQYLKDRNVDYSSMDRIETRVILVKGIQVTSYSARGSLGFQISPHNFDQSFLLFTDMVQLLDGADEICLEFTLNNRFVCLDSKLNQSAALSAYPDEFSSIAEDFGSFLYKTGDFRFSIHNVGRIEMPKYAIRISFNPKKENLQNIRMLIKSLLTKGIISTR